MAGDRPRVGIIDEERRVQAPGEGNGSRLASVKQDEKIGIWFGVLEALDKYPERWTFSWPVRLLVGGAASSESLMRGFDRHGFTLVSLYGMTETTALVTLNHPFKIARGSIGKPLAGREVQIGPDGEILVRGDSIASQVWQHGGLQAREAGWLATGDLATRNDAGELVFAGRKSDVIVTSAGLNIHPEDLEAVLRRQRGVRDALVVSHGSPSGPVGAGM